MGQSRLKRILLRWWKRLWWRTLLLGLSVLGFVVVVWPSIQWFRLPSLDLKVLVVNYTMPYREDRTHRGLFWLLGRMKVKPPPRQSSWNSVRDYIGYRPGRHPRFAERLSDRKHPRPDLLYVTDTYGVYRDDLKEEWRRLYIDRSPLVFGGLSMKDTHLIQRWVAGGTHLFLEFNSMCSPTGSKSRRALQAMVGVSWTSWIGRVFPNPNDSLVAPRWLKRDFEKQYPKRTFPSLPTLFLFHDKGKILYVSDRNLKKIVPRILLTPLGKKRFSKAFSGLSYSYWFALTRLLPKQRAHVYATLQLPRHSGFAQILERNHLSVVGPVFTERRCARRSRCFYMAADLSGVGFDVGGFRRTDALMWRQLTTPQFTHNKMASFWLFYVPVMMALLPELLPPRQ